MILHAFRQWWHRIRILWPTGARPGDDVARMTDQELADVRAFQATMRTCPTCGRSIEVTDEQITDLVARQATILRDFGSRLDYTEMEVCTLVNNAQPHEGVRPPRAPRHGDDLFIGLVQWRSEADRLREVVLAAHALGCQCGCSSDSTPSLGTS